MLSGGVSAPGRRAPRLVRRLALLSGAGSRHGGWGAPSPVGSLVAPLGGVTTPQFQRLSSMIPS